MKKLILLLIMLWGNCIIAQDTLTVKLESRPSSLGVHPAFEVAIPNADPKDAIDLWEKTLVPTNLLSIFKKTPKLEKEKDEWVMRGISIDQISGTPLDVYARVTEFNNNMFFTASFRDGQGFIGHEPEAPQNNQASQYVHDYALELYRMTVQQEIDEQEDVLKDLERELSKLQRKQERYVSKMKDAQAEAVGRGEAHRQTQMRLDRRLTLGAPGSSTGGQTPNYETSSDELQKQLKSAKRDQQKAKRSASKFDRRIRKNMDEQAEVMNRIDQQKLHIQAIRDKLSTVR
ncbi:hypothetical protein [Gaoshiqia sediminis]|uniref:Uncharacterized protein n=1 Tax=Gaoshiqia sediminis TaxID=2986998 RepID=A0AA41YB91_9BACT|nr:hypothetical protein [Gaoshiqia sediminis]MCW0482800.1 hypothetical protein [Gaoshiqia sediminis]